MKIPLNQHNEISNISIPSTHLKKHSIHRHRHHYLNSSSFLSPATKNTYLDHTLSICLSLSAFNDRNNFSKTLFLSLLSALPSLIQQPQLYDTLHCKSSRLRRCR